MDPISGQWEPNTRLTLSQADSFDIQNSNTWGTARDTGISPTSLGATVYILSHSDPGKRTLKVETFALTIPSFVHSASAPNSTGENYFYRRPGFSTTATLDINTGSFNDMILYAFLENDYYTSNDPALVRFELSGVFDPAAQSLSLDVDGMAYEEP